MGCFELVLYSGCSPPPLPPALAPPTPLPPPSPPPSPLPGLAPAAGLPVLDALHHARDVAGGLRLGPHCVFCVEGAGGWGRGWGCAGRGPRMGGREGAPSLRPSCLFCCCKETPITRHSLSVSCATLACPPPPLRSHVQRRLPECIGWQSLPPTATTVLFTAGEIDCREGIDAALLSAKYCR